MKIEANNNLDNLLKNLEKEVESMAPKEKFPEGSVEYFNERYLDIQKEEKEGKLSEEKYRGAINTLLSDIGEQINKYDGDLRSHVDVSTMEMSKSQYESARSEEEEMQRLEKLFKRISKTNDSWL